jgi:hypothetical protein
MNDVVLALAKTTVKRPGNAWGRAKRIDEYCRERGFYVEQVKVEMHNDLYWWSRRNRKPNERQAEQIGCVNSRMRGYSLSIWWVMPKEGEICKRL